VAKTLKISLLEESWDLDLNAVTLDDAFVIKGTLGVGYKAFLDGVEELDPDCLQTLVWFLKRPKEPALRREGVRFRLGDLRVETIDEGPTTPPSETPAADGTGTSTSSTDGAVSTPTPSAGSPSETSTV
jgi:hypothetical protein